MGQLLSGGGCGKRGCGFGNLPPELARKLPDNAQPVIEFDRVMEHALRSWAVYRSKEEIETGIFTPHIRVFKNMLSRSRRFLKLPVSNVNVFMEELIDGTQWIAIQGTSNLANIQKDLQYSLVNAPELHINCHNGFLQVSREAFIALQPLLNKKAKIRLTGHSLGGAVASLLALRLVNEGYQVEEVVTFGQPKVTDIQGSNEFLAKKVPMLRITNQGDPIPSAPPWSIFTHVGPELHLLGDGLRDFTWLDETRAATNETESPTQFWLSLMNVGKHFLSSYVFYTKGKMRDLDAVLRAQLANI